MPPLADAAPYRSEAFAEDLIAFERRAPRLAPPAPWALPASLAVIGLALLWVL